MSDNKFSRAFDNYVCEGNTITAEIDGFTITARIERDDCIDTPAERDDGFYPSLDPKAAGWIGSDSREEYEKQLLRASAVMKAWREDEWFYCGVVLSVSVNDIVLNEHAASLWGIECNYPDSDNAYLTEVANELLDEALEDARKRIAVLTERRVVT